MGRSQHKEVRRKCPVCGLDKLFPERHTYCRKDCANEAQRREAAGRGADETTTNTGDTQDIVLRGTPIRTLDELIAHCKVDLSIWEVQEFTVNKWEVGAADRTQGGVTFVVQPLFQVKARLRKRKEIVAARAEIEHLVAEAKKRLAEYPAPLVARRAPTGNMLEINIPDLHVGKLARGKETGYQNYDVRIAVGIHDVAIEEMIQRASAIKYDQIVYVVGNDILNSDDVEGRTTAGTQVTCDGRYKKTFRVVAEMTTRAIHRLRQIAPVKVVMVEGNHDRLSVWHLGFSLEAIFANYPDVAIDNAETTRKYHRYGKVMLMFTHGDKGKKQDKPLLMATEQRKMWGDAEFCEVHQGHRHGEEVWEKHGVKVRVLPSLCAEDDWHSQNEFVGNQRAAIAYQWNAEEGLVGTVMYTHSQKKEE